MVDTGAEIIDLVRRNAQHMGQLVGGAEHAVAEPDVADVRALVQRPRQDRHRVGIVQQQRVRAELLHILRDVEHDRDRAQATHDATDAERVADRLPQTILLGNLEIPDGRRLVPADLDHVDDVVGPLQRLAPVGRREDLRLRAGLVRDAQRHGLGVPQPVSVDVHEVNGAVVKLGKGKKIPQQVAGENGAACSNEDDLGHGVLPDCR